MSLLNASQIMEIIPHRQPFMLLDTIEEMESGKRVRARKCVTYNEPFFAGHFPAEPVMPGVLIVEAMAQAGAVAMLSQPQMKGKTAYFAGINSAKFKQKVVPGDVLELEVEIVKVKGPVGIGKGTATIVSIEKEEIEKEETEGRTEKINRKLAASAEIMFAIGSGADQ
ncbi:hypothetical protein C823_003932 [Eubacterium plexicaudatum ASF492]|uniref:3-hydroxyacyl-[acyl-carrier-protein] dehydratase n=1 Tax=Eubacterium plexicaudatum ASF492 TaxID=1235802 RepID=N2A0Q8_9FIRM|nr:hypothetical protein C823_003932 [Eubacterium plexicaudatum ASF492]